MIAWPFFLRRETLGAFLVLVLAIGATIALVSLIGGGSP
jgi:hypothetical protein